MNENDFANRSGLKRNFTALVLTTMLAALLVGCAPRRRPDLAMLYHEWAASKAGRPPLIGIHGLMGSKIVDPESGEVLWGKARGLFSTTADMRLALPVEPGVKNGLVPEGSIKKIGGVKIYSDIVQTIIHDGGYTLAKGSAPLPRAAFCPFSYDWRLSCADNAARLASFIKSIEKRSGDPSVKVDIVTHSMGGLVARYYILYGGKNVLAEKIPVPTNAGAEHVAKFVMLGTPNMGSVSSLLALMNGSRVGMARIPPELTATMPSMYELLPSPQDQVFFTPDGKPVSLDIYDVKTWERQRWGIFDPARREGIIHSYIGSHGGADRAGAERYLTELKDRFGVLLKEAASFHKALEAGPVPSSVKTLLLGGDCTPTLRGLVVERAGGIWAVRRKPSEVRRRVEGVDLHTLFYGPGDGEVTKSSLLAEVPASEFCEPHSDLPYALSGFVCEKHLDLVRNWTLQDNLLNFLLYKSLPAAKACRIPSGSNKTAGEPEN